MRYSETDSRYNPPCSVDPDKLRGNECLNCYEHPRTKDSELCRECEALFVPDTRPESKPRH